MPSAIAAIAANRMSPKYARFRIPSTTAAIPAIEFADRPDGKDRSVPGPPSLAGSQYMGPHSVDGGQGQEGGPRHYRRHRPHTRPGLRPTGQRWKQPPHSSPKSTRSSLRTPRGSTIRRGREPSRRAAVGATISAAAAGVRSRIRGRLAFKGPPTGLSAPDCFLK